MYYYTARFGQPEATSTAETVQETRTEGKRKGEALGSALTSRRAGKMAIVRDFISVLAVSVVFFAQNVEMVGLLEQFRDRNLTEEQVSGGKR